MVTMLLISAIGLSGMRSSRLETIMGKNMQRKQASFNNAESAVLIGEVTWDTNLITCLENPACESNVYPEMNNDENEDGVPDTELKDWVGGGEAAGSFGEYRVEYLGKRLVPGESSKWIYVYRLSSLGKDDTGVSESLIQTIYRRCVVQDETGIYGCTG
jgi:Tfp pilus assembly protein PilX